MISCQHGIGLRAGAVTKKAGGEALIVTCRTDSTTTPFIVRTIQEEEEGGCPQATLETAAEAAATFITQACFVAFISEN